MCHDFRLCVMAIKISILCVTSSAFERSLMYTRVAVAEKLHDAIVKFDMYRNLQWHRTVLPATTQHLVINYIHN